MHSEKSAADTLALDIAAAQDTPSGNWPSTYVPLGPQDAPSPFAHTMVDMTWPAVQAAADAGAVVLLPIGIIEAHGPHLDLSADIMLAHLYCRLLRDSLVKRGINALIAPPFYWGHAEDTARYAGTFSVRPETMKGLLADIFTDLDSWGFRKVFPINCHGDHTHVRMYEEASEEANRTLKLQVIDLGKVDIQLTNPPVFPTQRAGRFEPDYHAGAIETAQMQTFFPERVNAELARTLVPHDSFHPMGYCGDPASFPLEDSLIAFYKADLETDTRKIGILLGVPEQSLPPEPAAPLDATTVAPLPRACGSLEEVRDNIDGIDRQLIRLMAERSGYVLQAATFKKDANDVEAPDRKKAVLLKVRQLAVENGMEPDIAEEVYRTMIQQFIDLELREHARNGGVTA